MFTCLVFNASGKEGCRRRGKNETFESLRWIKRRSLRRCKDWFSNLATVSRVLCRSGGCNESLYVVHGLSNLFIFTIHVLACQILSFIRQCKPRLVQCLINSALHLFCLPQLSVQLFALINPYPSRTMSAPRLSFIKSFTRHFTYSIMVKPLP